MHKLDEKKEIIVLVTHEEHVVLCSQACGSAYIRGIESTAVYDRDVSFGCYQCGYNLLNIFPSEEAAFNLTEKGEQYD
jgi:predicted  nucleic acid-binding Zn-ribbon protein